MKLVKPISIIALLSLVGCTDYVQPEVEDTELSEVASRSGDTEEIIKLNCGFNDSVVPKWILSRITPSGFDPSVEYFPEYKVNVYTHVVRPSSGVGDLLLEDVRINVINTLNDYFVYSGLEFVDVGGEYNDNDALINIKDKYSDYKKVFDTNSHENALDVYVLTSSPNLGSLMGSAKKDFGESSLFVARRGYSVRPSTIAHEAGHCFGLFHTHHGTARNDYYEGGDPELVNGSNSLEAGDFIADTPADPCCWDASGKYNGGSLTDANGDIYVPNRYNMMSYAINSEFTSHQICRMYETIENGAKISKAVTKSIKKITGPTLLNPSGTFSIDVPDNYRVNWEFEGTNYNSTGAYGTSHNGSLVGKTVTFTVVDTDQPCQVFDVTAHIQAPGGKGYKFKVSSKTYFVKPNQETGILKYQTFSSYGNSQGTINLKGSNSRITLYPGSSIQFTYSDSHLGSLPVKYSISYIPFITTVPAPGAFRVLTDGAVYGSLSLSLKVTAYTGSATFSVPVEIKRIPSTFSLEETDEEALVSDEEETKEESPQEMEIEN